MSAAMFAEFPPRLAMAHEHARDELRRADTKATTLLSVVALALAGVIALTKSSVAPAALVALWLAAVPVFAAVLVLLAAIRPRLSQFPTPGTWLYATQHGPSSLLETSSPAATEAFATDVCLLGGIAVDKHRRIGRAVSLLVVGVSVLPVALVLSVLA